MPNINVDGNIWVFLDFGAHKIMYPANRETARPETDGLHSPPSKLVQIPDTQSVQLQPNITELCPPMVHQ